ncbi:MAG: hypothetical protein UT15_C0016G0004 [Berkelbacteria bacterium GW2011_GWA1_39_10]|uniref:Prepilin-type N-terminal cleavage/methylation domain-containing protein n=2 Tax=Candidatus Berkelbacteria TaxID=1618330 RepID=A0A0G0LGT8_9BACT|nr:MAG: hypothetical protein UT15_C0016G0004 [Berkelbacteria bacterium GW2011_GWA1_39_10]
MKKSPLILFTQINTNKKNSRRFVKKIKKAFTLIEILLAVFVLEIGLLGIVTFYSYAIQVTKIARNETTAANLASGILDNELSAAYDNLTVGAGTKIKYSTDTTSPFYAWDKKIDVAYINSSLTESYNPPDTNMKKIVVTIYWQESGNEKSFQTASIKAKH